MSEQKLWKCLSCGSVIADRDVHAAGHPGGVPLFDALGLTLMEAPDKPTG